MSIAAEVGGTGLTVDRRTTRPPGHSPAASPVVDDVDLALLRALVADARTSQRGLARQVGMSPPAVGERIARLERLGFIRGYRADVDYSSLGASLIVYLGIVAVQGHDQRGLIRRVNELVEVESVDVITGPLDLLLRLRVRDHAHLRDVLFEQIWAIPGVNRTETFISLDSAERKDFGGQLLSAVAAQRAADAADRGGRRHDGDGG